MASKRSYLLSHRKEKPPPLLPSRCHAPLPKPLAPPSLRAPHPPKHTGCDSKLSNLASHRPQNQLNNPRESHSSTVLQRTGSDTCGSSSSSFLPWNWMKGRELLLEQEEPSASHSETGTAERSAAPGETQSHGRGRLTDNRNGQ